MRSPRVLTALILVIATVGLVAHMRVFQFVTDDAFISFVYAKNLALHGQLVFNLGEPVEGYTNFLWTVLLAGLMKLGWLPESSSVVLGTAFGIATFFVCAWLAKRLRNALEYSPWDALPAVLLAIVPGYACWSSGGLETQMFTFFTTLGIALYLAPPAPESSTPSTESAPAATTNPIPEPLRPASAIAFGLAALTRPEGDLFFALVLLHRTIFALSHRRLRPRRDELLYVFLFLALVVPHFLWRHHYYGYWLPNTFYIKSSGGAGTWGRGVYYLRRYAEAFLIPLLLLPALVSLYRPREPGTNRLYRFAALFVPVFFLYVASVGGDFMGLFRFALPVVPLIAVTTALGLRALVAPVAKSIPRLAPTLVCALLAADIGHTITVDRTALGINSDHGIDSPGYLRYYTEDRAAIGRWFGKYAQADDYAAVGGAGAQVYYSGIRSLDCFGLSDAYIAHQVRPVDNRPGHEKYAPREYQLSKRPTIITSNYYTIGNAPHPLADAEQWRKDGYQYVSVKIDGLSAPIYTFLKRMDRRIGPLPPVDADLN